MNPTNIENEHVTDADLARVAELDAKATKGPWGEYVTEEFPPGWIGVRGLDEDRTSDQLLCDTHVATLGRFNDAQAKDDLSLIAEYRTLCPRIARELIAARAQLDLIEAAAFGAHGWKELKPTGRQSRIVFELAQKVERVMDELEIEVTRTFNLRAQIAADAEKPTDSEMLDWKPLDEAAENATEILGYNPEWVHDEFCPDGIRSCVYDGEVWHSSTWRDDESNILKHCYGTPPTHYRKLPPPPKQTK